MGLHSLSSFSLAAWNAVELAKVSLSQWSPTLWTASALQLYHKTLLLSLLGKWKILLAGFNTLFEYPPCCSSPFGVIWITSELFSEAKILHALKQ